MKLRLEDGEEEFEFEGLSDPKTIRMLQLGRTFEKRGHVLKQQQQQVKAIFEALERDPEATFDAILKAKGSSLDQFSKQRLAQMLEQEGMSDEQKEHRRQTSENAQLKQQLEQLHQHQAEAKRTAMRDHYAQKNWTDFGAALEASSMPKSPYLLAKMAETQIAAKMSGQPPLSPQQLAQHVEEEMTDSLSQFAQSVATNPKFASKVDGLIAARMASLDGAELLAALTEPMVRKVTAAALARHRGQQNFGGQPQQPTSMSNGARNKPIDEGDAQALIRSLSRNF